MSVRKLKGKKFTHSFKFMLKWYFQSKTHQAQCNIDNFNKHKNQKILLIYLLRNIFVTCIRLGTNFHAQNLE